MATLALIIAVVALVIAIAAYRRTGGVVELQNHIQTLSSTTDSVRDRTADALNRLEQLVRGGKDRPKPDDRSEPSPHGERR